MKSHERLLKSTFEQITLFLTQQTTIIDHEINRTNNLVSEAVVGIADSFKLLQHLSQQQQTLIQIIMDNQGHFKESHDEKNTASQSLNKPSKQTKNVMTQLTELDPKITEVVAKAVRSLQFEDLTRQALLSLKNNMQCIELLATELQQINWTKDNSNQNLIHLQRQCKRLFEQAEQADKQRSVSQSSMDEGGIDLF